MSNMKNMVMYIMIFFNSSDRSTYRPDNGFIDFRHLGNAFKMVPDESIYIYIYIYIHIRQHPGVLIKELSNISNIIDPDLYKNVRQCILRVDE